MNIPVWYTNAFYTRKPELKRILSDSGIKKSHITEEKYDEEKLDIKVSFENHYLKATKVAILICKEIFNKKEATLVNYETHLFTQKQNNH